MSQYRVDEAGIATLGGPSWEEFAGEAGAAIADPAVRGVIIVAGAGLATPLYPADVRGLGDLLRRIETNGLGWILDPTVGGYFVFSGGDGANANAGLTTPYVGIGIFVALLFIIFAISPVPDLHAVDESRRLAAEKNRLKPSGAQLAAIAVLLAAVCGLLYFF